ncbi:MAG: NnrS family protein [Candidatus Accumulibacter sp.]|nr:NnrS family protein [Accumulibacter sp.]
MKFLDHPFWLVGFRPFFTLACLAGIALPLVWVLLFVGAWTLPAGPFSPVQWHAHEMFFGFGWAVLGGFLLTATKNWVKIRGYHGAALLALVVAWLLERAGMWFAGHLPPIVFRLSNVLFLGTVVSLLLWSLIRHRRNDAFADNYFFLIILPLFLLAKILLLSSEYFTVGTGIALGLFRVAFLVMLERTVSQFMRNALRIDLVRHPLLDRAIKLLALPLIFASLLPAPMASGLALLLAVLIGGRWLLWHPHLALRRLDIGIMYLGQLAIVAQLLLESAERSGYAAWTGSLPMHVFAFGAIGLIVPAMLVRIAKGHTGRPVVFEPADKMVLWIMIAGLMIRTLLTQVDPVNYPRWIAAAAGCWMISFAILGWRYIPFFLQPRIDGKDH